MAVPEWVAVKPIAWFRRHSITFSDRLQLALGTIENEVIAGGAPVGMPVTLNETSALMVGTSRQLSAVTRAR